jgi:hypothetical protein
MPILRSPADLPSRSLREHKLQVRLPVGAQITLYGADRSDWIDRLYGQELRKIWIDEAAFYSVNLKRLIVDVLEPTIAKQRGSITLMCRPGHICRGFYWQVVSGETPGWSVHKWGWEENPHVAEPTRELIEDNVRVNPHYLDMPEIRRNWFNEWTASHGQWVYNYSPELNGLDRFDINESNVRQLKFILGVDFGWTHNTAFVVGCEVGDTWIELESHKEQYMDIDQMAARIRMYQDFYPGLRIVADPGGYREMGELKRRYRLPVQNAEKQEKLYWINQYNADMKAGKVKIVAPGESPHVDEMIGLAWETDTDGQPRVHPTTKELIESRTSDNDCCDAALYAYRASRHHQYTEQPARPKHGSPEYYERIAQEMIEEEEEAAMERP